MSRRASLSAHSRRLTPVEVAQLWFRRGRDFAECIHTEHPSFPKAGPDGLFLLSAVEAWFDHFHGTRQRDSNPQHGEEQEIMRVINGIG